MLYIRQVKHLARQLGVSVAHLEEVANNADLFCEELTLIDPNKPDKQRSVLNVTGALRRLQRDLLRVVLMPKLKPSPYSHGGVSGRHIKTNISCHLDSVHALVLDISDFFPSVSSNRVYKLFTQRFCCSPDVARICTMLCTYNYHLALGLITSPFLADQILHVVDHRIACACKKAGLVYTRFVDDITISGTYNLHPKKSGLAKLVQGILADHGFEVNPNKTKSGRLDKDFEITKLRIKRGHTDVRQEYITELERQIKDARNLADGRPFEGPYYTRDQIAGRLNFVCWVNPGRRRSLKNKFRAVQWNNVLIRSQELGLFKTIKELRSKKGKAIAIDVSSKLKDAKSESGR
ncbi:MAG: RNA-directed DNA polymerase [Planctomycetes bacterium]|nr:RNA-directed DNA polymerase [Planctomycetota bacterium]